MFRQVTQQGFDALRTAFGWMPDWFLGGALLVVAVVAAVLVHGIVYAILLGLVRRQESYTRTLLRRIRRPSRLALILLAVAAGSHSAAFTPEASAALSRVLVIGSVIAAGWMAWVAVGLAADLYLDRIRQHADSEFVARKHITQIRILKRAAFTVVVIVTTASALMTIEAVRQFGVSLFASAGIAGLVIGLAARPVLTNIIGGLQLAVTQPIRIGDQVIVENEFGDIEEITSTYVVVRLWDWRRMVVPLSYFLEKPFQNWTRDSTSIIGVVLLYVDFAAPIDAMRAELGRILESSRLWDKQVAGVQVTDATPQALQVRILVSARSAGEAFDLRCEVREKMMAFLRDRHPDAMPLMRRLDAGRDREARAESGRQTSSRERAPAASRH